MLFRDLEVPVSSYSKFFFNPDYTDEPPRDKQQQQESKDGGINTDLALLDLSAASSSGVPGAPPPLPPSDDALLDLGFDDSPVDHEKEMEGMPTLTRELERRRKDRLSLSGITMLLFLQLPCLFRAPPRTTRSCWRS